MILSTSPTALGGGQQMVIKGGQRINAKCINVFRKEVQEQVRIWFKK